MPSQTHTLVHSQVTCGILSGLGPYIMKGTTAAKAQVLSVAAIKLSWAAILACYSPCVCGLANAVIVSQYVSEGTATILLLMVPQVRERQWEASPRGAKPPTHPSAS